MVNFKDMLDEEEESKPTDPREIFNALPKPSGINDLYASQAEVLNTWYKQRNEKDVVIKLHTGGGKTLVALLMAQSAMRETGDPVLYLTPTNQLVDQVLLMSEEYGVPALPYTKGEDLPAEFHNGEAVLVGAYQALFNGRSKFGVLGSRTDVVKVGTIILDDAHFALSSVRDAFTLDISADKHRAVYTNLADRFRADFNDVDLSGSFEAVIDGKDFGIIEVPSWAWHKKIKEVQQFLSNEVKEIDDFVWPFLRDNLGLCHCLFSKKCISITPIFPLVDMLPTFEDATRRIYMSATIADDSEILRTFDASLEGVKKPITATTVTGIGERMILVPKLMQVDAPSLPFVKQIATDFANNGKGVAILVPSFSAATEWMDIADCPENTDAVSDKVKAMQKGNISKPLVLANRYDGIDLEGDACRLLIMDGLPKGTSNYDLFRTNVIDDTAVNSFLAQRIEQGIGRGTRGSADQCVVMLVGRSLVSWIGQKRKVKFLNASTRIQLEMGQKISNKVTTFQQMKKTICNMLKGDPEWKLYHANKLAAAAHAESVDELTLEFAAAERKIFRFMQLRLHGDALVKIEKLMNNASKAKNANKQRRAWLAALAAHIAYQIGNVKKGQEYQIAAFAANKSHSPPRVRPLYQPRAMPSQQSNKIVELLSNYNPRMAVLEHFKEATANLVPEASSDSYEEALAALGTFLGFDTERPDDVHKIGPDVLWRTADSFDFVIEAKNQKDRKNPLYRKDHGQLLEAENWFRQTYRDREVVRVSALPEAIADANVTPAGSFAFRLDAVIQVANAFQGLIEELVRETDDPAALRDICEIALTKANLKPEMLRDTFMKPFGKAKPQAKPKA